MNGPISVDDAARWSEYWRRSAGSREQRKALENGEPADVVAVYDKVAGVVERGGPDAVATLVALAEAAPDGEGGVAVGVGPVEDLVHLHGDCVVDALADAARRSPPFAGALTHVDLADGCISAASRTRLAPYLTRS